MRDIHKRNLQSSLKRKRKVSDWYMLPYIDLWRHLLISGFAFQLKRTTEDGKIDAWFVKLL